MPFDYLHSEIPGQFSLAPDKAKSMYRLEVKERAALLRRLGYGQDETLRRLETNFAWDWEVNPPPPLIVELRNELAGIVAEAFAR
ncbi:MAG: hypothetical protein RBU45_24005 [Myxococcota bacterium]|jgi:hypothetical protein|nr:hypothetical protein [Myxococcota bacterium]